MTDTVTNRQAARVFDSEINRLERLTRNAGLIIEEMQTEYFEKYSPLEEEGKIAITWEYNRNKIRMDILDDLCADIEEVVIQLEGYKTAEA